MGLRIIVNDREVSNPLVKFLLILGAMLVTGLVIAAVVFILLPLVGITIAVSVTFVVVVVVGTVIAALVMAFVGILYSIAKGSWQVYIERRRHH